MKTKILALTGIALCGILFSFYYFFPLSDPGFTTIFLVSPDGERRKIEVEIADSQEERQTGLMHRSTLAEGRGMLFLFDEQRELAFWMKNTLIPLEVLYFDENYVFVSRSSMVPCAGEPCPHYSSNGRAKYALEVGAGDPVSDGVGQGWQINF